MNITLTVSGLNEYVRKSLAADPMLKNISLRGEISNFKDHYSGHWYFSLKDEKSRIDCVMFRQYNLCVHFHPKDGDKVVLEGTAGLYAEGGKYQFYADGMKKDGVGDLHQRFEELKARLLAEGLFDAARKRPLPCRPRMIGVVTSRTGAVIHDIAMVARRRDPSMQLVLCAAQVQGEGAAQDIVRGIEALSHVEGIDVIIIGRGGGSMEDLWAFNEEIVARAIAACPVPVISAVGHETDFTISDFVADARAATPSNAAEMAVPVRDELQTAVEQLRYRMEAPVQRRILLHRAQLNDLRRRLQGSHPLTQVREMRIRARLLQERMTHAAENRLREARAALDMNTARLHALGPENTLKRGFVIAMQEGKALRSAPEAGEMTVLFADGTVKTTINEVKRGDPFGKTTGI